MSMIALGLVDQCKRNVSPIVAKNRAGNLARVFGVTRSRPNVSAIGDRDFKHMLTAGYP